MKKYLPLLITLIISSCITLNLNAQTETVTFTADDTWTVPAGVTEITVECWGGGGAGGGATGGGARGGGGGGGAYASATINVTSGQAYDIFVGALMAGTTGASGNNGNPSYFDDGTEVYAVGGSGGLTSGAGGNGGSAAASTGDVTRSGGNGGAEAGNNTGGGGGGAGSTQAGSNASGITGGTGGADEGGDGANGVSVNNTPGNDGNNYGGGGSGGKRQNDDQPGGSGAPGFVRITYNRCFPPVSLGSENIGMTTARITWDENPDLDTGITVGGYEYYYSTSDTPPAGAGTATTNEYADLTGLTEDTQYYFWVRTDCEDSNYSIWSAMGTFTTLDNTCFPPVSLDTENITQNSARLLWQAPVGSIDPIAGYEYYYSDVSTPPAGAGTAETNEYVDISGLDSDTEYYFWVRSDCSSGSPFSNWSAMGTFTTMKPIINVNPDLLNFGFMAPEGISGELSFEISGSYLTATAITITAPVGFQVSLSSGAGFAGEITITDASVLNTTPQTIYVRFTPPADPATFNDLIVCSGGSANNNPTVTVIGYSIDEDGLYIDPGTHTWTCPPGVFEIIVECIGAGGGGGSSGTSTTVAGGGGGGGGAFASSKIAVIPGTDYIITVGAAGSGGATAAGTAGGNSSFENIVIARGGAGGARSGAGGAEGSANLSTGEQRYDGGKGFNGIRNTTLDYHFSGGGGGGASTTGIGAFGSKHLGGVGAAPLGGDGGNGRNKEHGAGFSGEAYGAGGGGGLNLDGAEAAGANAAGGAVRIIVSNCVYTTQAIAIDAPVNLNTVATSINDAEYITVNNIVEGNIYIFRTSVPSDWLSLTNTFNGIIAQSSKEIIWTADFSGTARLHIFKNIYCVAMDEVRPVTIQHIGSSCPAGTSAGAITPDLNWNTVVDALPGTYYTFSVTNRNEVYIFSFCRGGGTSLMNNQLEIHYEDGTSTGYFNEYFCGQGAEITFLPPKTGNYRVSVYRYDCQSDTDPAGNLAYRKVVIPTQADCLGALPLCQNLNLHNSGFTGEGNYVDIPETSNSNAYDNCADDEYCLLDGEQNNIWYRFTVQSDGYLSFTIKHKSHEIYDWALFELTNDVQCLDLYDYNTYGGPKSCSWYNWRFVTCLDDVTNYPAGCPELEKGMKDTVGTSDCHPWINSVTQEGAGNPWNTRIYVTAGQTYALIINNFISVTHGYGTSGYSIDFSASTANIIDNTGPSNLDVAYDVACGSNMVTVRLSEPVYCDAVSPETFTITGPGGNYEVVSVWNSLCMSAPYEMQGNITEALWTIEVADFFDTNGEYIITLNTEHIVDPCGNYGVESAVSFIIDSDFSPVFSTTPCPPTDFDGVSEISITNVTGGTSPYSYYWEGPDSYSSELLDTELTSWTITGLAAGYYYLTITDVIGRCDYTTMISIGPSIPDLGPIVVGDYVWCGYTNNNWNELGDVDNRNWLVYAGNMEFNFASVLPDETNNIFISDFGTCVQNTVELSTANACNDITIASTMVASGAGSVLTVNGHWKNTGLFNSGDGTVIMNGTEQQHILAGTSSFYNLTLNNSTGFDLGSNMSIRNTLNMTSGNVTNNNYIVTLGTSTTSTGTLNYTDGTIYGRMRRWFAQAANSGNTGLFPIGHPSVGGNHLPAIIEYADAPLAGGTLMAEFVATDPGLAPEGVDLITIPITGTCTDPFDVEAMSPEGFWRFTVANSLFGGKYDITLDANGFQNILDLCELTALKRDNGDPWESLHGTHVEPGGSFAIPKIKRTGVETGFSDWAIGRGPANPLPVDLISFEVNCDHKNQAILRWSTASEINNDYFVIEKSRDAKNFVEIAKIDGHGFSNEIIDYSYTDSKLFAGDNYYRLKQVDYDGTSKTYRIIFVNCQHLDDGTPRIIIYPNPFNDEIAVFMENISDKRINFEIHNELGSIVYRELYIKNEEPALHTIRLERLKPAMYNFRFTSENYNFNKKIIKQ